jgi:hypothetical protein
MIYSKDDVKRMLDQILHRLRRYDHTIEGWECCGVYSEMEQQPKGSYVEYAQLVDEMNAVRNEL